VPGFLAVSPDNPFTFLMPIESRSAKNEPVDRAIRRMKKKLERENSSRMSVRSAIREACEKRRRKAKVAAFTAMLRARYAQ
jgi:small subunit ribosomal protein S21